MHDHQASKPGHLGEFDRRGASRCMGWAGTGAVFALAGGVASSVTLEAAAAATRNGRDAVVPSSFVQISDTHIGFAKAANPDPLATLRETIAKVQAPPVKPAFAIHTGDITHLAKPEQFDTAQELLGERGMPIHFVPGEHDITDRTDPTAFLQRFGKDTQGDGWYSFDANGVHFIALVNSVHLGDRGMGSFGDAQQVWLKRDVTPLSSSTPVVVFSHFPIWALFPDWGWGTADAVTAFTLLKRFGSVTALNGHIHQIQQKTEGNVVFHSARSTAYPQPAPGVGPGPSPLVLPAGQLRSAIGISTLEVRHGTAPIAILDATVA